MKKHEIIILSCLVLVMLFSIGYFLYKKLPPKDFGNAGGGTTTPTNTTQMSLTPYSYNGAPLLPVINPTVPGTSIPLPPVSSPYSGAPVLDPVSGRMLAL